MVVWGRPHSAARVTSRCVPHSAHALLLPPLLLLLSVSMSLGPTHPHVPACCVSLWQAEIGTVTAQIDEINADAGKKIHCADLMDALHSLGKDCTKVRRASCCVSARACVSLRLCLLLLPCLRLWLYAPVSVVSAVCAVIRPVFVHPPCNECVRTLGMRPPLMRLTCAPARVAWGLLECTPLALCGRPAPPSSPPHSSLSCVAWGGALVCSRCARTRRRSSRSSLPRVARGALKCTPLISRVAVLRGAWVLTCTLVCCRCTPLAAPSIVSRVAVLRGAGWCSSALQCAVGAPHLPRRRSSHASLSCVARGGALVHSSVLSVHPTCRTVDRLTRRCRRWCRV